MAARIWLPFFDIDNHAVGPDSAALLFDLGHRRLGLINGPIRLSYAIERLRGFHDAHRQRALQADPRLICQGMANESHGYSSALALLSRNVSQRPTAIICATTLIAAGVLRALSDKGLKCPDDLSIVAHDDGAPQFHAADFNPPLTVTRAPLRDACAPLANALVSHLSGTPASELQNISSAELVVRHSTAACRDSYSP